MKLRSKKEYKHVEPVKKFRKLLPKTVQESRVKKHKFKPVDKVPKPVNQEQIELKGVRVVLNRIKSSTEISEIENKLRFVRAYETALTRMSTDGLKPIEDLKLDGNISENWRIFKRNFDIIFAARGIDTKTEVVKISTFLNAAGQQAIDLFDSFKLTAVQLASYTEVIKAFEDFCTPRKNVVFERYKFGIRNQKEGEPFDVFLMDIKKLAQYCAFHDVDEMIRDRIVIGTTDSKLRTRLLEMKDLTLEQAVEKVRASETSKEQNETMGKSAAINEISAKQPKSKSQGNGKRDNNNKYKSNSRTQQNTQQQTRGTHQQQQQRQRNTNNSGSNNTSNRPSNSTGMINNCTRCGRSHKIRECPAFGKQCNKCSKSNHFSSVCKQQNISTIDAHDDSNDSSEYYIGTINCQSENSNAVTFPWIETIEMNGKNVAVKIDTGAETDVLPLSVVKQIKSIELRPTSVTLRAFGGEQLKPSGMCTLLSSFNGISHKINFAVVDLNFVPIFGLKSCVRFGIVQPSRVYKNSKYKNKEL